MSDFNEEDFDRRRRDYHDRLIDLDHLRATARSAANASLRLRGAISDCRPDTVAGLSVNTRYEQLDELWSDLFRFQNELRVAYDELSAEAERELDIGRLSPTWSPGWELAEAQDLFEGYGRDDDRPLREEIERLVRAGRVLARAIDDLALRGAHATARAASLPQAGPEGWPLVDGTSPGGRRHYLAGKPVHAGDPLYLLSRWGWIPGRFESGWGSGEPLFYFRPIPGSDVEVGIETTARMRFARPRDISR